MSRIRTSDALAQLAVPRLVRVYLNGHNYYHVDKHQVPFAEWLLYWMAQPLTDDNPVDQWADMDSDAELAHYGYESGDGEDAELVREIFRAAGVEVPEGWHEWDGMGDVPGSDKEN